MVPLEKENEEEDKEEEKKVEVRRIKRDLPKRIWIKEDLLKWSVMRTDIIHLCKNITLKNIKYIMNPVLNCKMIL